MDNLLTGTTVHLSKEQSWCLKQGLRDLRVSEINSKKYFLKYFLYFLSKK